MSSTSRSLGGAPDASEVVDGEAVPDDVGERILVQIGHPLALRGKALVPQPLAEVSAMQADGGLGIRRPRLEECLEPSGVGADRRVRAKADHVRIDLEDRLGIETRAGEAAPDEPQSLPERRRRTPGPAGRAPTRAPGAHTGPGRPLRRRFRRRSGRIVMGGLVSRLRPRFGGLDACCAVELSVDRAASTVDPPSGDLPCRLTSPGVGIRPEAAISQAIRRLAWNSPELPVRMGCV